MGKHHVFINGKVFTSNREKLYADAFITEDGVISWIGRQEDLPETDGPVTDLKGKRVIPGFVDCHMHPTILADCYKKISCLPPKINSIEELIEAIREERSNLDGRAWIEGWGYDEGKLKEHRAPNRYDLDKGAADVPISLLRTCAHMRAVNSKALELAGITKDTPDPPGGQIDRDENGEPTGILRENARNLVAEILPKDSREAEVAKLVDLGEILLSQGIVAITDMGCVDATDYYDYYTEAAAKGLKQTVGIYYMWDLVSEKGDFTWNEARADRSNQIQINGLKLLADGSVSGHTAWMSRPYKGTKDDYGISVCSDEELDSAIEFCKEHHCQLSVHAMGARAIQRIIDRVYDEENWMNSSVPHLRMEHITEPSEDSIKKAAEKKIAFATQPIFLYSEIESYLLNLGEDWMKETYPIDHLLESGVKVALSTDAPATSWAVPSDPFPNIKGAVTRTAYDGTDCSAAHSIDIETAIQLYTREGAEVAGFEKIGQLREGYRACFAVLNEDILTIDPQRIDQVYVEETWIDGTRVYARR